MGKILTFTPTDKQFENFEELIESIEKLGAAKGGIAKIKPPKSWKPGNFDFQRIYDVPIPQHLQQRIFEVEGKPGIYVVEVTKKFSKTMTVAKLLEKMKKINIHQPPPHRDQEHLLEIYWQTIGDGNLMGLYGSDVAVSLMDAAVAGAWLG